MHAYIIGYLHDNMPVIFKKDKAKAKLIKELDKTYFLLSQKHNISLGLTLTVLWIFFLFNFIINRNFFECGKILRFMYNTSQHDFFAWTFSTDFGVIWWC